MPKFMMYGILVLITLLLVPPAVIAWRRTHLSSKPRIHLVQDMDNQPRFEMQHATDIFRDGRTMRPVVEGTVSREGLELDGHFYRGVVGDDWAATLPTQITVNRALLERGQERFGIYCAPCHGYSGYGDGMVHKRAMRLLVMGVNGTEWVQPKSLHETLIAQQPVGKTFNTITNGIRNMPAYGPQIPTEDRWAIVAYVKALQMSQNADVNLLPADLKPDVPAPTLGTGTAGVSSDDTQTEAGGS